MRAREVVRWSAGRAVMERTDAGCDAIEEELFACVDSAQDMELICDATRERRAIQLYEDW